jgi:ribulose-phosphate 3-epimerase
MSVILPTVTAFEPHEYREQIERIAPFSLQVHIDLMDGDFAPTRSPLPEQIWWPHHMRADLHLMFRQPLAHIDSVIALNPRLVIVHAESEIDHRQFTSLIQEADIMAGISILPGTSVAELTDVLALYNHVLVFSGKLGYHGGSADLGLLEKVERIKAVHPQLEVGWDGGINAQNAGVLVQSGVDVLNVGGYIQKASEPEDAYATLVKIVEGSDDTKTDST